MGHLQAALPEPADPHAGAACCQSAHLEPSPPRRAWAATSWRSWRPCRGACARPRSASLRRPGFLGLLAPSAPPGRRPAPGRPEGCGRPSRRSGTPGAFALADSTLRTSKSLLKGWGTRTRARLAALGNLAQLVLAYLACFACGPLRAGELRARRAGRCGRAASGVLWPQGAGASKRGRKRVGPGALASASGWPGRADQVLVGARPCF